MRRERPRVRREDGFAELQRLPVADHHQESDPLRPVRSRSPMKASCAARIVRCATSSTPTEPGLAPENIPEHAIEQRRLDPRQILPAVSRRHRHHVPFLHRYLGHPRPHRRARLRASDEQRKDGSSKPACVTTRRPPPTSTRTSSRAPTTPTSWRATRSSRTYTAITAGLSATYRIQDRAVPVAHQG